MKKYSLGTVIRVGAWGTLIGGAAGFALGMFLAPEEGETARRRVAYHLENLAARFGMFVEDMVGPEPKSEARQSRDALVAEAEERAQRIRQDIDDLIGEMRKHGAGRS